MFVLYHNILTSAHLIQKCQNSQANSFKVSAGKNEFKVTHYFFSGRTPFGAILAETLTKGLNTPALVARRCHVVDVILQQSMDHDTLRCTSVMSRACPCGRAWNDKKWFLSVHAMKEGPWVLGSNQIMILVILVISFYFTIYICTLTCRQHCFHFQWLQIQTTSSKHATFGDNFWSRTIEKAVRYSVISVNDVMAWYLRKRHPTWSRSAWRHLWRNYTVTSLCCSAAGQRPGTARHTSDMSDTLRWPCSAQGLDAWYLTPPSQIQPGIRPISHVSLHRRLIGLMPSWIWLGGSNITRQVPAMLWEPIGDLVHVDCSRPMSLWHHVRTRQNTWLATFGARPLYATDKTSGT